MKILALENDPKEYDLLQSVLNGPRLALLKVDSSEQAWTAIQSGLSHFLIANWDTSDVKETQLIQRIRAHKSDAPIHILLTSAKPLNGEPPASQADDFITRPFNQQDLKNRVAMAERIISLACSLASARSELETQAVFDPLTGFMNHRAFVRQALGELERARRASLPLSLIALDLDHFQRVNEKYSQKTGDEILKVVSNVIREKSRPYDCIGRWMGDEFIILVAGVIGADAEKIAERIIAGVRGSRIELEGEAPLNVKVSAGVASAARISASAEIDPLIEKARFAVARAQEAGGNQVFMVFV
ncbi:MAG: diguanylate cyclase [Anaerolineales bacterium]|nr:diguanylate cyclase [Anaerolineales bacterium]